MRGEPWSFIHSEVTGQHVRINGITRQIVRLLDSETSLEKLIGQLSLSDDDEEEREALALGLLMLSNQGLICLGTPAASSQLQRQAEEFTRRKLRAWHNPLAVRFALLNPDAWLAKHSRNRWRSSLYGQLVGSRTQHRLRA